MGQYFQASSQAAWNVVNANVVRMPTELLSSSGMWLSASRGVTIGTGVSAWVDQCASPVTFSQGTGSLQPAANTSPSRVTFDGTDDYLTASTASKHQWTTTAYVAGWVRRLDTATGDRNLWSQWDAGDVEQLILRDRNSSSYFEVVVAINATTFATVRYPNLTVNSWQFFEMIYDGSQGTAANRVKFYYDGVEQTSTGGSGTLPTSINGSTASAILGTFQGSGATALKADIAHLYSDKTLPNAATRVALKAFEAPA